jgi:hypothetical protein
MGHLVEAVGDSCREDANATFATLVNMMPGLAFDDPALIKIKEVAPLFAACLKEQFVPYLPGIFNSLIADASANIDISLTDASAPEADDTNPGQVQIKFDLRGLGTKQLAINTSALEGKISAVKMIYNLVKNLGKTCTDYVEATMAALTPLFNYRHNDDIRKYSAKACGQMIHCLTPNEKAEAMLVGLFPTLIASI